MQNNNNFNNHEDNKSIYILLKLYIQKIMINFVYGYIGYIQNNTLNNMAEFMHMRNVLVIKDMNLNVNI